MSREGASSDRLVSDERGNAKGAGELEVAEWCTDGEEAHICCTVDV